MPRIVVVLWFLNFYCSSSYYYYYHLFVLLSGGFPFTFLPSLPDHERVSLLPLPTIHNLSIFNHCILLQSSSNWSIPRKKALCILSSVPSAFNLAISWLRRVRRFSWFASLDFSKSTRQFSAKMEVSSSSTCTFFQLWKPVSISQPTIHWYGMFLAVWSSEA